MAKWPMPDGASWRVIKDPARRLKVALRELYSYYRETGPGLVVVMRDAPLLRPGLIPSPSRADHMHALNTVLLEGWGARGRRREVLRAAIAHATSPMTWQSLVRQQGLGDDEAVALLTAMVLSA